MRDRHLLKTGLFVQMVYSRNITPLTIENIQMFQISSTNFVVFSFFFFAISTNKQIAEGYKNEKHKFKIFPFSEQMTKTIPDQWLLQAPHREAWRNENTN